MFLSFYAKRIQAKDDKQLAWYVDQVEATVGAVGIAEKIRQRYQYIRGKTSQWWLVQKAGIEFILKSHSVKGHCVFSEKASWSDLDACLKKGPVILGTKKIGGLAGGHIILIVDKARNGYIVNDPFGEGLYSKYAKKNGHGVFYGKGSLAPYAEYHKDELFLEKRSVGLTFGKLSFHHSTRISIKGRPEEKSTLFLLKKLFKGKAIRLKEEVNKDELKDWPTEKLTQINAKREERDNFGYEIDRQAVNEGLLEAR